MTCSLFKSLRPGTLKSGGSFDGEIKKASGIRVLGGLFLRCFFKRYPGTTLFAHRHTGASLRTLKSATEITLTKTVSGKINDHNVYATGK